jgi:hypothetical protein
MEILTCQTSFVRRDGARDKVAHPPKIPTRFGMSRHQRFTFHCPAERLCHRGIEVGDGALDPLLQMLLRGEIAAAEEFAHQVDNQIST